MSDFESLAGRLWDNAAADGKPTWRYLSESTRTAIRQVINATLEEAAKVADGTEGPFPPGERIHADGTAAVDIAIAMQHGLGGGRDAIAAAIRALKSTEVMP